MYLLEQIERLNRDHKKREDFAVFSPSVKLLRHLSLWSELLHKDCLSVI